MKRLFYSRLHRHIAGSSNQRLRAYSTNDPDHLSAAKRLHAEVYLQRGFIYEHDVGIDGLIDSKVDPHQHTATYFVVTEQTGDGKERVVATARQIRATKKGAGDLPLLQQAAIKAAHRRAIEECRPAQCVEVSALVKRRGYGMLPTLLLYRVMWRHSRKQGDRLWLMACSPLLVKRLRQLFGSTLVQIGPPAAYTGEEIIPVMVWVDRADAHMRRQAKRSWHLGKRLLYRELIAFFTTEDHFLLRRYE